MSQGHFTLRLYCARNRNHSFQNYNDIFDFFRRDSCSSRARFFSFLASTGGAMGPPTGHASSSASKVPCRIFFSDKRTMTAILLRGGSTVDSALRRSASSACENCISTIIRVVESFAHLDGGRVFRQTFRQKLLRPVRNGSINLGTRRRFLFLNFGEFGRRSEECP